MTFYESINKYYNNIFPYQELQAKFILKHITQTKNKSLLDIGCATGQLAKNIAHNFNKIYAIDLNTEMLSTAKESINTHNIHFYKVNMLDLNEHYENNSLDVISCFGNTLVHLDSDKEVYDFLNSAYNILNKGGKILLQIINYDRIIDNNINCLPTIENSEIKFVRNYTNNNTGKISFETILDIKKENKSVKNTIELLALRKHTLDKLLQEAGFDNIQYYGNFRSELLNTNSTPLIVVANK